MKPIVRRPKVPVKRVIWMYITGIAAKTRTFFFNVATDALTLFDFFSTWMVNLPTLSPLPRVASISAGFNQVTLSLEEVKLFDVEAIKLLVMGVTIVSSSGDDGANSLVNNHPACGYAPHFPATSQYVLAVGATSGPGALSYLFERHLF